MVTAGMWHHLGKVWKRHSWIFPGLHEGDFDILIVQKKVKSFHISVTFRTSRKISCLYWNKWLIYVASVALTLNRVLHYTTRLTVHQHLQPSSLPSLTFLSSATSLHHLSPFLPWLYIYALTFPCLHSLQSLLFSHQSYQWLKEKIVSEDGRKQQAKLKELNHIAEKLGCTLPQLAVGKTSCPSALS